MLLDLHGYGPSIMSGAVLTVQAALVSLLVASALGMVGAGAKLSPLGPVRIAGNVYTTLIRGVPDLVLMLLIFYGGQTLVNSVVEALGSDEYYEINSFMAGACAIGFIYGAYMTETFRGAILAVARGQLEAGRAFGMSGALVFRRILMPQMMRHALPGFGNNWLVLLKATALMSVIGMDDMLRKAGLAAGNTHKPFTFYLAVALAYLAMTSVSSLVLAWAEHRYSTGFKSRA
jgi:arginine/ornithine transport system permease protein